MPMKRTKYFLSILTSFTLYFLSANSFGQNSLSNWTVKLETAKVFIENKGQFPVIRNSKLKESNVIYAFDDKQTMIYFRPDGVTYSFRKQYSKEDDDIDKKITTVQEWKEKEAEEHIMDSKSDAVTFYWENSNPNVEIIAENMTPDYYSYSFFDSLGVQKDVNLIHAYKKLTYKNLYPNIDVEYSFYPTDGIKYTLILHPGADISKVSLKYSGNPELFKSGDIHISTIFGDIIDHAPVTYYSDDKKTIITSSFKKQNDSFIFDLGSYDNSRTIVIDPWTQTPALPTSHAVMECERDGGGNVYIIGGESPMQLLKYNAAGTLQWTYNTPYDTANFWLGTFSVDLAGNSFVTGGSVAALEKVNTSGTVLWTWNSSVGSSDEYWNIAFNCDQTKLIVGGTKNLGSILTLDLKGAIFDINTSNGSVNNTQIVGYGNMYGIPINLQEVRSISSCRNSRYYFLTLDTIGCIDQNFSICPSSNPAVFKTNSGYSLSYKCENYRPNNGNGGIMSIRANRYFVYTQNGTTIHKRSLGNGSILASSAIPGGLSTTSLGQHQVGNSGIDIDTCGNVYVGSGNAVIKYDANLTQITSVATSYKVYDVAVSLGGNVIICGATGDNSVATRTGYVQSINMGACNPMSLYCCDANICPAGPFCNTAAPVTLTAATPGGTWSGTGITNASAGTFSPGTAGQGTFTIYYTLACGMDSTTIIVNACATLTACQESNGTITVSGGTGPYTWQSQSTTVDCSSCPGGSCIPFICPGTNVTTWTTFATGTNATPTGTYPIRVKDVNNNILVINSLGSLPFCTSCPTLTITTAITNILCFGQSTGSFTASSSGGATPYDYTLVNSGGTTVATYNNIAGTQAFSGLPAGTYTLNVMDNNNCPGTKTIIITQPASAVVASISGSINASCGLSDGSATVAASGGTPAYTYNWNTIPAQTTATASNIPAGSYSVTVSDANSCTVTTTVTILNNGAPTLQTSETDASCGNSNGSATVTATGGSGTYSYSWSCTPVQSTFTATNLPAGTYTVTVNDGACTATTSVIVNNLSGTTSSITNIINATCGNSNGGATVIASGGTQPYTYLWSSVPAQTTSVLQNVSAGNYTVTVSDLSGCTSTSTVNITNSAGPTLSQGTLVNATCGMSNGSATVIVTGGQTPYAYLWNTAPVQTTATASGIPAGTYIVTVTDANSCATNISMTISGSPGPSGAISGITDATCGLSNGSATLVINSGTLPYTYSWNSVPVQSGQNLQSVPSGSYTVTVTDANSCTATANAVIGNVGGPSATATSTNEICDQLNGTATVAASGGTGNYTYLWNNGQTTASITGLAGGSYTVTVNDGNCATIATVTVMNIPGPTAGFSAHPQVLTSMDGPVSFLDNSSGTVVNWQWYYGDGSPTGSGNTTTHQYQNLGTYVVTLIVTDNNGCMDTVIDTVKVKDIFAIYIPDAFTPDEDGLNDVFTPKGLNVDPNSFDMYIFDRWGNIMFHSTKWYITNAEPWNGTKNNSGTPDDIVMGVYVYKINLRAIDGPAHEYIGRVSLIK